MPAKIRNVIAVPTVGIVTKVGRKVPMMLPIVFSAPSLPTVLPLSSRLPTVYFTSEGVTVPSRSSGNTNRIMQAAKAAHTRKFFVTTSARTPVTPAMTYLPTSGIQAIQTAASSSRR